MSLPDLTVALIAAFYAVYVAVVMLAPILGGWPERAGSLILLLMFIVQASLYSSIAQPEFLQVDWSIFLADLVMLGGFGALAYTADRNWPIVATIFACVSMLSHLPRGVLEMAGMSYAQFNVWPTAAVVLTLGIGAINHRVRAKRDGKVRDWYPYARFARYRRLMNV